MPPGAAAHYGPFQKSPLLLELIIFLIHKVFKNKAKHPREMQKKLV